MDGNTLRALRDRAWDSTDYHPEGYGIWRVPSMLTTSEKKLLAFLTEKVYTGEGSVLDLGCFLGGSSAFLSYGVMNNLKIKTKRVHSFDTFRLDAHERDYFFPTYGLKAPRNNKILGLFKKYTLHFSEIIEIHEGNILRFRYDGAPIEILFIDIMKSSEIYDYVIGTFFQHLIPNQSIVILQDYLFKKSGPWHHVLMELLDNKFLHVANTDVNSMVYLNTDRITREDMESCLWKNVDGNKRLIALVAAMRKLNSYRHREILASIITDTIEGKNENKGKEYNV